MTTQHPAIGLAPESLRGVLGRMLEAGGVALDADPADVMARHCRALLNGDAGDPWVAFALGLHRPELLAQLPVPDEVIGALDTLVGGGVPLVGPDAAGAVAEALQELLLDGDGEDFYQQPDNQATAPAGADWAFGEAPVFLAGGDWSYRPGVLPDEIGAVPPAVKPAVVTGGAVDAFASAVDAGFAALTRDVIADQGDPMSGVDGPRRLSRAFVEEYGRTALEWRAVAELVQQIKRGTAPAVVRPSSIWDEIEKFRQLLAGFRGRYATETGGQPSGTLPEGPGWAGPAPDVPSAGLLGGVVQGALSGLWALGALALLVLVARR